MTRAAKKIAGGCHSTLALLLCVVALAAAVDSDGAPNDTFLRDSTLAWTDVDCEDDPDDPHSLTANAYAVLCGRLSAIPFPRDSEIGLSLAACWLEMRPACVQSRAPPCSRELRDATSRPRLISSAAPI